MLPTIGFPYKDAEEKNNIWKWHREELISHCGKEKVENGLNTIGLYADNFDLLRSIIGKEGKGECFERDNGRYKAYRSLIPVDVSKRVSYSGEDITGSIPDHKCDYLLYDSCGCLGDDELGKLILMLLNWRNLRDILECHDYPSVLAITCTTLLRRGCKRDSYNNIYSSFINKGIADLMIDIFGKGTTVLRRRYQNDHSVYPMYSFIIKIGKSHEEKLH